MIRVEFAETFEERLEAIEEFLLAQDVSSAATRRDDLLVEIYRFGDLVGLHPKIGRPAGALQASSVEGQVRLERVLKLAIEAGLAEMREYVLRSHLILYAHSDARVLLLSIRHQRELGYAPE
ncbi:type II toxin-antitoxin system RelE/ParE family toxin [Paraburkholderia aromaticivorans]|uniref:type II toxin-antitoxin system RelE/ParE family toxin n=1 Tax=Paraburkholderia aromaticivorans TaxID=2026199 RepID=UPI0014561E14|nr:type II toxin-antitoxin system RelE/ParE family toxin [Paraburkholderia aromaticivorans]